MLGRLSEFRKLGLTNLKPFSFTHQPPHERHLSTSQTGPPFFFGDINSNGFSWKNWWKPCDFVQAWRLSETRLAANRPARGCLRHEECLRHGSLQTDQLEVVSDTTLAAASFGQTRRGYLPQGKTEFMWRKPEETYCLFPRGKYFMLGRLS